MSAIWAVAGVASLAFAERTAYGPVIFTLDRNHGVHRGDLVAVAVFSSFAAVFTYSVSCSRDSAQATAKRQKGKTSHMRRAPD